MRTLLERKVIKLAYTNPELRKDLLPLIKKANAKQVLDFVLNSLQDYTMMFVINLVKKHRDRADDYRNLILTLKHDNPHIYQIVKAAWGRKARSMMGAAQETVWMRDFMKEFRKHMENFLGYVVGKSSAYDMKVIVDVVGQLLDNPRWLLKTLEKGFDKGLQISKAV